MVHGASRRNLSYNMSTATETAVLILMGLVKIQTGGIIMNIVTLIERLPTTVKLDVTDFRSARLKDGRKLYAM